MKEMKISQESASRTKWRRPIGGSFDSQKKLDSKFDNKLRLWADSWAFRVHVFHLNFLNWPNWIWASKAGFQSMLR